MSGTPHSPIHHDVAPAASQSSLLLMIVFMVACGQMAQTIFVPALPQIALGLNVDASQLQAVMACYLLSYGMFQFVYGPVSDRVGRKMPLVVGIAIFIIGAVFAAQATSFNQLIMASLIQGLGTASAGALCRSIPRDHYFGDRLVKFNSYVSMAVVFLPLLAPFIGSASAAYFGWQAVYWVLAGFGAVVWLLLIFAFKESLPKAQREHQAVIASYRHVLRHRAFRAYLFSLIATFAGIAAFEAIAGVLYGQYLGLTPFMVSCYFVAPIPGYLLGALIAGRQNKPQRVIYQGVALLGAGALFMLIPAFQFGRRLEFTGWIDFILQWRWYAVPYPDLGGIRAISTSSRNCGGITGRITKLWCRTCRIDYVFSAYGRPVEHRFIKRCHGGVSDFVFVLRQRSK